MVPVELGRRCHAVVRLDSDAELVRHGVCLWQIVLVHTLLDDMSAASVQIDGIRDVDIAGRLVDVVEPEQLVGIGFSRRELHIAIAGGDRSGRDGTGGLTAGSRCGQRIGRNRQFAARRGPHHVSGEVYGAAGDAHLTDRGEWREDRGIDAQRVVDRWCAGGARPGGRDLSVPKVADRRPDRGCVDRDPEPTPAPAHAAASSPGSTRGRWRAAHLRHVPALPPT